MDSTITLLTEKRGRPTGFAEFFSDDAAWNLSRRADAKARSKKLSRDELFERAQSMYLRSNLVDLRWYEEYDGMTLEPKRSGKSGERREK